MLKKIFLIVLMTLLFVIGMLWFYSGKLQNLVEESGRLADERCNTINPKIIAYKQAYIDFVKMLQEPDKYEKEAVLAKMDEYLSGQKAYLPLEEAWLKKLMALTTSKEFRFYNPSYMQDLAASNVIMYQSLINATRTSVSILEMPAEEQSMEQVQQIVDARTQKEEAITRYYEEFDKAVKVRDWRKYLWHSPDINCPVEFRNIPDAGEPWRFPPGYKAPIGPTG